jgi:hypothetical protein
VSLTVPVLDDLVAFSGQAITEQYYDDTDYIMVALQQAADLMTLTTGLEADPTSEAAEIQRMLTNAILQMAEALVIMQPYRGVILNPFASETIGAYTYSKLQNTKDLGGGDTGLHWWDQAVEYFDLDDISESSSTRVFEDDNVWVRQSTVEHQGRRMVLGPADIDPTMYGPIFKTSFDMYNEGGYPLFTRGAD